MGQGQRYYGIPKTNGDPRAFARGYGIVTDRAVKALVILAGPIGENSICHEP
jgi:hypothetical protein